MLPGCSSVKPMLSGSERKKRKVTKETPARIESHAPESCPDESQPIGDIDELGEKHADAAPVLLPVFPDKNRPEMTFGDLESANVRIPLKYNNPFPSSGELEMCIRDRRRNAALRSAVTIAEFSDPPFRGDVARTVFPAYFLYLKRWARQFDYFTIPVEKTLPCYTPYIDRDRVRIIPQGFDLSTVRRLPYTPHAKPVFAYAGRFYERIRDPKFFFDFLATLDTDFRFDLYVNYLAPCFREMIREAQGRVTGEIALHDPLPREKLIERLSQADFEMCIRDSHYAMNDKGLSDRSPETEIAPAGNYLGRGDFSIIRLSGPPLEHKTLRLRSRRIFPLPYFLSASADGAENSGLSSVPA